MTKYWTGVGSRGVPDDIKILQEMIGARMVQLGYTLLSGNAHGSDVNFYNGVCQVDPKKAIVWLPWSSFNKEFLHQNTPRRLQSDDRKLLAGDFYKETGIISWWDNFKQGVKSLHGRNYEQVMNGEDYPVSKVCIYYAPEEDGVVKGGTKSAVEIFRYFEKPTYNLYIEEQKVKLLQLLEIDYGI